MSIPASGLPPCETRQAKTTPQAWGRKAGQGGFAASAGISCKAAAAPATPRALDRLKAAEGANFGRNRPIGARCPGAAGEAAAGVGRAKGAFSIAGASPLALAHDQLLTG